jgi:hypothetical protein
MTDLPTPAASRLRAPSWRDSRLVVGVLLVLLSTVLGAVVVARADDRVPVWAVKGPVSPGQQLTEADVVRVDVLLGDGAAPYLPADTALPADTWALRDLRPGELVPVSAVGGPDLVDVQQVALLVDSTSASTLARGSVVDVYVNRPTSGTTVGTPTFEGPERALESVAVVRVAGEDAVLGGATQSRAVHVMVPRADVQALVADVDAGSRITLVPVPGGVTAAAS